jgi:hypothetical protein
VAASVCDLLCCAWSYRCHVCAVDTNARVLCTPVPRARVSDIVRVLDGSWNFWFFGAQFVFWTTCGDMYYLGLDAIALYDAQGQRIPVRPSQIHAIPSSINELARGGGGDGDRDVRVSSNLAKDYAPDTWSNSDAWLAPLAHTLQPGSANLVYIAFHQPVCLSMLKVRVRVCARLCICMCALVSVRA